MGAIPKTNISFELLDCGVGWRCRIAHADIQYIQLRPVNHVVQIEALYMDGSGIAADLTPMQAEKLREAIQASPQPYAHLQCVSSRQNPFSIYANPLALADCAFSDDETSASLAFKQNNAMMGIKVVNDSALSFKARLAEVNWQSSLQRS